MEALKQLRVHEGQEDHLFEGFDVSVQASHLIKADGGVHLQIADALGYFQIYVWSSKLCVKSFQPIILS